MSTRRKVVNNHKIKAFTSFGRAPTLEQVWLDYQYHKPLSAVTERNYEQRLRTHLGDWLKLPVTSITPAMVQTRHSGIKGASMADSTMRTLRALLVHADKRFEAAGKMLFRKHLPTRILSRKWFGDKPRTKILTPSEVSHLTQTLMGREPNAIDTLVLLLLFTGLRKHQVIDCEWSDVDFEHQTIRIKSVEIPLSVQASALLTRLDPNSKSAKFVFANHRGDKPICAANKSIDISARDTGVSFSLDDLSRTFKKMAEDVGTTESVLRRLLGRAIQKGDTAYGTERLRASAQKICDALLRSEGRL